MAAKEFSQEIPDRLYFRIGDVADLVGVKPYVLRYWETEFTSISPQKSNTGQRVYRRTDVENLLMIKHLLYKERYSIEGARKRISELRKDGELKTFKTDLVAPKPSAAEVKSRTEQVKELRSRVSQVKAMLAAPIDQFFKW